MSKEGTFSLYRSVPKKSVSSQPIQPIKYGTSDLQTQQPLVHKNKTN